MRLRVRTCLVVLICAAFFPSAAFAVDYCRVYSGPSQSGAGYNVNLPALSDTYDPNWYGASSRRRTGAEANSSWYKNGESLKIRAMDSDVVFYAYTGRWMDGDFQAVRCKEGNVCTWNYGWMRNQMRSFNCQRELNSFFEIPTNEIADEITLTIDSELPKDGNIKNAWIRHGRMFWTNVRSRCERTNVGCKNGWEQKYDDILEFNYKGEVDVKWIAKHYDVWIDFWFEPQLIGRDDEFHVDETYWRIRVEGGLVSNKVLNGVAGEVQPLFDGGSDDIGETVTDTIYDGLVAQAGVFADAFWKNNRRVEMTYRCSAEDVEDHLLRFPGTDYSDGVFSAPCGSRTPVGRFAPIVRVLKSL